MSFGKDFRLSVIVPVFNEIGTLAEIVRRLCQVSIIDQIVLVDDASTDGTRALIRELALGIGVSAGFHDYNRGKGAAVRTGLTLVTSAHVLIQDADLEYNPQDIYRLAAALSTGVRVVYGSRLLGGGTRVGMRVANYCGNRALTMAFNLLYNQRLSDIETCYKLFTTSLLRSVGIDRDRFDIDPELSAKLVRCGEQIIEVPISYHGRSFEEGKKIRAGDALDAIRALWHYRSWSPTQQAA